LGQHVDLALFIALTVGFAALVVMAYFLTGTRGDIGMTTELAALLTYVFGAMTYYGYWLLAAGLAVATTVLLSLRRILHEWVRQVSEQDLYAALKLAVITVIVLPLLPDADYGPERFQLFNPFRTWLLVVLVSAVGFLGYVGMRVLGPGWGLPLSGLLGGLVSSTAVTLALAARAREEPRLVRLCALGIGLSWAAMGLRILLVTAFVHWPLVAWLAVPIGLACGIVGVMALLLFGRLRPQEPLELVTRNPFSLWAALRLAGFFLLILTVVRLAQLTLRESGLLVAALLAGTADMDAITLSLAQLAARQDLVPFWATLGICLAAGSNTLVKTAIAYLAGSRELGHATLLLAAILLVAGLLGFLAILVVSL
jgi:uncharacterized membrane protein (DUF4010 family)